MKIYLAGAESSEYHRALVEQRALSLQSFYAAWSLLKMAQLAEELAKGVQPKPRETLE